MCIMSMSGWGAAEQSAHDERGRRLLFDGGGKHPSAARELRRGVSSLMYACQQGDVETVRRVLHVQPFIAYQRDRTGKSAVHYCCTSDSKHAAEAADFLLMAAPELVDGRDEDGFTPLHLAVIAGNMPLVTFLLASKADVNAVDSEKHTVIHWATVCGETEALRACLAAGAPVSTPDVHGGYPLHYAAQMCGGEKDHHLGYQVLQTLLSHPDISISVEDGDGRQPLLWAASAGSTRALLALIKAGAAVESADKDGLTALHCAASRGHTDCLDTLLTLCGASVDVIDSNGCTALHYAVTLGHADATALLLSHGANANRQDRKGRSPAHCGCAKGQLETVKMLGAHGANLWLRNARGDLPLHEAAGSGRRELVKWLLEARPSQVNARNNDGRCPLHLAALNDNADMCKILLDHGAQINPVLRTSKNLFMTPLDCALQRGFRSTAKYLQLQSGLPANRLGSMNQGPPNTAANDGAEASTSGSEREGPEAEEKQKKRTYKRKLAYRHEKKITGSDAASAKSNKRKARSREKKPAGKKEVGKESEEKGERESPQEKIIYNSEVNIIDNSENINIKENGSITINKETPRSGKTGDDHVIQEVTQKEIIRPKSARPLKKQPAKQEPTRRKTKADTPDPRRKDTLVPQSQPPHNTPQKAQDINDNIREIESLAQSIEEKAKNICKEVNNIDTINANPDLQSLTSFEESEHQNLIVEASVHPPPKQQSAKSQEDMYKAMISSLKEELETIKGEIKGLKLNEDKIKEVDNKPAEGASNLEIRALKELKDLLEGRMQEIKNTVEEFKLDIKNVIRTNEAVEGISLQSAEEINFYKKSDGVSKETSPKNTEDVHSKNTEDTTKGDISENIEINKNTLSENPEDVTKDILSKNSEDVDKDTLSKNAEDVDKDNLSKNAEDVEKNNLSKNPDDNKDIIFENQGDVDKDNLSKETEKVNTDNLSKNAENVNILPESADVNKETIPQNAEDVNKEAFRVAANTAANVENSVNEDELIAAVIIESDKQNDLDIQNNQMEIIDVPVVGQENKIIAGADAAAPGNKEEIAEEPLESTKVGETTGGNEKDAKTDEAENSGSIQAEEESAKDVSETKSEAIAEKESPIPEDVKTPENIEEPQKVDEDKSTGENIEEAKSTEIVENDASEDVSESKSANDVTADITEPSEKIGDSISDNPTTQIDDLKQEESDEGKEEDSKSDELEKKRFLKSEKKEHHVNLMNGTPQESSIETKSSDDEAQATDTSDSSALSVATKREHKSFTVLDTDSVPMGSRVNRKKERKSSRKSRSKSEETRLMNKENLEKNHERLRRSKIPTVLSKSEKDLEKAGRRSKSNLESRIPILPNLNGSKTKSETNLTGIRDYSDNEQSDNEESVRKRRTKRKSKARSAKSAGGGGSDYESSNLIDSGFEPSPRSSRIPKWKNVSDRGVNMSSVTQSIQGNIRKYHLERKIFQHLLELKRMQIRAGQHNESMLVKRAIDSYHRSCASTVGAGRYLPKDFTFRSFEHFLYESLRKIQKNAAPDYLRNLPETATDNPLLCTQNTNRCMHATHAYTGIPCAAYLPKMDHHTIPKIGFGTSCKPQGFLPDINGSGKKAVTLELCHGNDKQVISLPTDRLDQNKRYYVTFTVKGQPSESSEEKESNNNADHSHRHPKSV